MARRLLWTSDNLGQTTIATGGLALLDLSANLRAQLGANQISGFTVTRMIGEVGIRPVAAGVGLLAIAAGILVVTEDAVSVGVTAIPQPRADAAHWLWWHGGCVGTEGAEISSGVFEAFTKYVPIDSRAQRKVDGRQTPVLVLQNAAGVSIDFAASVRILWRAP